MIFDGEFLMADKKKVQQVVTWTILIAFALVALVLGKGYLLALKQYLPTLKYAYTNYKMGTYNKNLSAEELIRKRTLKIGNLTLIAPPRWTVMKDFPRIGTITFDLDSAGRDGTIDISVEPGSPQRSFDSLNQREVTSVINNFLSSISTLKEKNAEMDASVRKIKGIEWRSIQATDEVSIGKRHTGIYYSVIRGDLIILYYFSIADSPNPILQSVEELISRFNFVSK